MQKSSRHRMGRTIEYLIMLFILKKVAGVHMERHEKAIIIGGGVSGKLAARVLSEFFKETIGR